MVREPERVWCKGSIARLCVEYFLLLLSLRAIFQVIVVLTYYLRNGVSIHSNLYRYSSLFCLTCVVDVLYKVLQLFPLSSI